MKLARPDIFHPRIVLAGTGADTDDAGLVAALRRRGLNARWLPWDDPESRDAHLVILRDARDRAGRLDEFRAWTHSVPALLNPPAAVEWNLGARHLRDLADAGVPTGASGPAATALIFFAGEPSHAVTGTRPAEPGFEAWDLGHAALAAAAASAGVGVGELLCARVDVSGDRVSCIDVVTPPLGWRVLDDAQRELAQRRFALAVESACDRLGLGPLSHRDAHGGPEG